jgi:hypothetical protein
MRAADALSKVGYFLSICLSTQLHLMYAVSSRTVCFALPTQSARNSFRSSLVQLEVTLAESFFVVSLPEDESELLLQAIKTSAEIKMILCIEAF